MKATNGHDSLNRQEDQNSNNLFDKCKRCLACFFPNSFQNYSHDDDHHANSCNGLIVTINRVLEQQSPLPTRTGTTPIMNIENNLNSSQIMLSSPLTSGSNCKRDEYEEEDGDHEFLLQRDDHLYRPPPSSKNLKKIDEIKLSHQELNHHDQQMNRRSSIFNNPPPPHHHYSSYQNKNLPEFSCSTTAATSQSTATKSLDDSADGIILPISKPIPCPKPKSPHESDESFQGDVEYYNHATWNMYHRIMYHRTKRQQQQQQDESVEKQQHQQLKEERGEEEEEEEVERNHNEDDCNKLELKLLEQSNQQYVDHHHQQHQRKKSNTKRKKKRKISLKHKGKVQPLLDEMNKTLPTSSLSLPCRSASSSPNTTITAATSDSSNTALLCSCIGSSNSCGMMNQQQEDNEVVFQLDM